MRDARDWKQFHNPKDLATALAIEASELQEKFLWKSQEQSYEIGKDLEVHEEFADVMSYLILFAEECNIDIEKVVMEKMKKKMPNTLWKNADEAVKNMINCNPESKGLEKNGKKRVCKLRKQF